MMRCVFLVALASAAAAGTLRQNDDGAAWLAGPAPAVETREPEADSLRQSVKLFTNRRYVARELPARLAGLPFLRSRIEAVNLRCTVPGLLYALTPSAHRRGAASQEAELQRLGFRKVRLPEFQLFGRQPIDIVSLYQKRVEKGERIRLGKWTLILGPRGMKVSPMKPTPWNENAGERLYNGIVLPKEWPPQTVRRETTAPARPPYLDSPPAVISIAVGRQLFVDDFLIEHTTLERTFHAARKYEGNPVLKPETPLEMNGGVCPVACPFSDGIFYDPQDQRFKMWYHAGWFDGTALAVSRDGIHWERPDLGVVPGTNRVIPPRPDFRRDGVSVWLDHRAARPDERFKMFLYARSKKFGTGGRLWTSPDGVHWTERVRTGPVGDNTTLFYNPFRRKWVLSIRTAWRGRTRDYREHSDFLELAHWEPHEAVPWAAADDLDRPDPDIGRPTQLYKVDAVGYESVMLGLMQIHYGPPNNVCAKGKFPKLTELMVAFSRDGFHWDRTSRQTFIGASRTQGHWERGYIHSAGGCCLVVGDKLFIYYGAFSGVSPKRGGDLYAGGATGLAVLRRDGFASMDTGEDGGTLTTRPVTFPGKHLFVNAGVPRGELRVEVLDDKGKPIPPFTRDACTPVTADSTRAHVSWRGAADLSAVAGKPVRFRFHLRRGRLYAFWVSPERHGASHGYVAAGGPGFTGPTDEVGVKADEAARQRLGTLP
jgi:hypothetical protein